MAFTFMKRNRRQSLRNGNGFYFFTFMKRKNYFVLYTVGEEDSGLRFINVKIFEGVCGGFTLHKRKTMGVQIFGLWGDEGIAPYE